MSKIYKPIGDKYILTDAIKMTDGTTLNDKLAQLSKLSYASLWDDKYSDKYVQTGGEWETVKYTQFNRMACNDLSTFTFSNGGVKINKEGVFVIQASLNFTYSSGSPTNASVGYIINSGNLSNITDYIVNSQSMINMNMQACIVGLSAGDIIYLGLRTNDVNGTMLVRTSRSSFIVIKIA